MLVPIFTGRVLDGGLLVLDRSKDYGRYLRSLAGKPIELVVRKQRTQRSLDQNAYIHAVPVSMLAEHCGYTKDEAHEAVAWKFLREGEPDAPLPKRRSTTDLDTKEFEAYTAQVKQFAAEELGLFIPDPAQVDL